MRPLGTTKTQTRMSNSTLLFIIAGIIFVLMYGFALISYPGSFMQFQTFFDLFNFNAALFIVTLGLCVVMIGGGIDISVGAVCGLVTMACAMLLESERAALERFITSARDWARLWAHAWISHCLSRNPTLFTNVGRNVLGAGAADDPAQENRSM